MQSIKLYVYLGVAILLVGAAAFIARRMFNARVGTVGLGGPSSGRVSISLEDITAAPELPATRADITGSLVERKDNTIVVQAVSFDSGVGGIAGDSHGARPRSGEWHIFTDHRKRDAAGRCSAGAQVGARAGSVWEVRAGAVTK